MNSVEFFRLRAAHMKAFGSNDLETRPLDAINNLAGDVAARGVRLDDREGSFDGHFRS
jgi:hypothetical protein